MIPNVLPEVSTIGAGVVGYVGNLHAVRHADNEADQALSAIHIAAEIESEATSPNEHVRKHRLYRAIAASVMTLVGAGAGFSYYNAFRNTPNTPNTPAVVDVVIDGSANPLDDGREFIIDKLASDAFSNDSGVHIEGVLAAANQPQYLKNLNLSTLNNYGSITGGPESIVATVTQQAVGQVKQAISNSKTKLDGLVVVLTDTSSKYPIENLNTIAQEESVDNYSVPIFVVDAGDASSSSANALRQIADQSHGNFLTVNAHNESQIAAKLRSEIRPDAVHKHNAHEKVNLDWLALAVGLTAATGAGYGSRASRRMPSGFNRRGE